MTSSSLSRSACFTTSTGAHARSFVLPFSRPAYFYVPRSFPPPPPSARATTPGTRVAAPPRRPLPLQTSSSQISRRMAQRRRASSRGEQGGRREERLRDRQRGSDTGQGPPPPRLVSASCYPTSVAPAACRLLLLLLLLQRPARALQLFHHCVRRHARGGRIPAALGLRQRSVDGGQAGQCSRAACVVPVNCLRCKCRHRYTHCIRKNLFLPRE